MTDLDRDLFFDSDRNMRLGKEYDHILDFIPETTFFVKDLLGRYTYTNNAIVRRLGLKTRDEVIGQTVADLFPLKMAKEYLRQDRSVLAGAIISDHLEPHLLRGRSIGWCLTHKRPVWSHGEITGVIGFCRNLCLEHGRRPVYARLFRVYSYLQKHYAEDIRIYEFAESVGIARSQLQRHFRRVFQISPQQMLTRVRIDAAMRLLKGVESVASISQMCGFVDQSAFARQFKAAVGMTPMAYRNAVSVKD